MSKVFTNPVVRMVARALLAGVLTFAAQLQAADTWDGALLRSALAAGIMAFCEWFTPINPTVGRK